MSSSYPYAADYAADSGDAPAPSPPASTAPTRRKRKSPSSLTKPKPEKRQRRYRSSCPAGVQQRINRAVTQRLYLVQRDEAPSDDLTCSFVVLGSTGNVYTVRIAHQASCTCPDHAHAHVLCKHILFVLLKVMRLPPESPLLYQAAWLTSELQEMFSYLSSRRVGGALEGNDVLANERVRTTYAKLQAGESVDEEDATENEKVVQRRSLDEDGDCPICFDSMQNSTEPLTYCRAACGANFHAKCMDHWATSQRSLGLTTKTCPNCRQPWEEAKPTASSSSSPVKVKEGYANLGQIQGQSPVRDTSTYYHGWSPSSYKTYRRRYR